MNCRTGYKFLIACSVVLCATLAIAADEPPTQLFQLNGFAGSTIPSRPGSDGLKDPGPGFLCDYGSGGVACDNWNLLNGPPTAGGNSNLSTFIHPATLVFTKGTKDTADSSTWDWAPHGSPGKDTFNAGYAAAYSGPSSGDLIIEFGADRATNNGDANIAAWFFQLPVAPNADGTFGCGLAAGQPCHVNGDIFVTSAFVSGGGVSVINTFAWDTACSSITSPTGTTTPGQCADTNLALLLTPGTECGSAFECGITNASTTHTSWEGAIASPQFFEGGVNVTAALKAIGISNPPCFSTFQVETRSSQSTSAELKAFIQGNFRTCSMNMTKACTTSATAPISPSIVYNNNVAYVHYTFGGALSTKSGAVYDPVITDTFPSTSINLTLNGNSCTAGGNPCSCVTNTDTSISCSLQITGSITSASPINYTGSFDYPATGSVTNNLQSTASSSSSGAPQNVVGKDASTGNTTSQASFGGAIGACHVATNPVLTLTKYCDIRLEPTSSGVVLRQDDTITVCNTSTDTTTQIKGISVVNNVVNGPSADSIVSSLTLGPNSGSPTCKSYPVTYTPTNCDNSPNNPVLGLNGDASGGDTGVTTPVPGRCEFKDTASISGTPTDEFGHSLSSSQIPSPYAATCNLCLFGYCTASTGNGGPTN